ncbi:MAG: hypothetical protein ACYC46_08420 [Acidobacteriaceae bacterium]
MKRSTRLSRLLLIPAFLLTFSAIARAANHTPPPAGKAADYPAVDSHPLEHVTIAAEPFDTPEKAKFFRIDYLKYDFLPVRIIVTNDGDKPINLTDVRMQFISAAGDRIPAALPEEVERRTDVVKNPAAPGVKLGMPFPTIHGRSKNKDKPINEDFNTLGFQAFAVEPHTTQSGFLFYDIRGLDTPVLKHAQILVKMIKNADGKQLFDYVIPMEKYLAAQSSH